MECFGGNSATCQDERRIENKTFWNQHENEARILICLQLFYLSAVEHKTLQKYHIKAFNDNCWSWGCHVTFKYEIEAENEKDKQSTYVYY